MIDLTTYDLTGRLLVAKSIDQIMEISLSPTGLYVDGLHDPRYEYVEMVNRTAQPRPPNTTLLTGTTLYNIPLPSQIVIDGTNYGDVTDSTVELKLPLPGAYHIDILSFPPLDAHFTVTV